MSTLPTEFTHLTYAFAPSFSKWVFQLLGQLSGQLSSIERLELALALFMIVASRVQMFMRSGRTWPDMDSEAMFERDAWQAACIVAPKPIPKTNTVVKRGDAPRRQLRWLHGTQRRR